MQYIHVHLVTKKNIFTHIAPVIDQNTTSSLYQIPLFPKDFARLGKALAS